ncbi:MAG TPA: ABC transporter substrate-binding protein [Candidatus Cloacimonadota bacterium]|jgi:ABC-type amino acid transport substrate-binding protein|nr:ABC transporter substrate-binding protein [Candidatus Cloacimonadales bacterium]HPY95953.1 ABC transporter substrate-binding protein [Candidatus Cloacimonadota bacterium]HQB40413.1 ABC transporter substrate-binding protein [Candidatus Cloacimonadota bacterium]
MKRRLLLLTLFTITLIILFTACQNEKNLKELRVGVSSNLYPFNYIDSLGVEAGFEIDMVNQFCKKYHFKPVFTQNTIPHLLTDLKEEKLDLVISSLSATTSRKVAFNYSNAYYNGNQALIGSDGSTLKIKNLEQAAKYKIGVLVGSSGEFLVEKQLLEKGLIKADKISKARNITSLLDLLEENKVDLILMDKTIAEVKKLNILTNTKTDEEFCVLMPLESSYKTRINRFLKKYLKSNEYNEAIQHYFN